MVSIDAVTGVKLLDNLNENELKIIKACCEKVQFKHGEKIFEQGEAADNIWIVGEGEIGLRFDMPDNLNLSHDSYALITGRGSKATSSTKHDSSKQNTIAVLKPGKTFGWGSFVPPYTYALSAYCNTGFCVILRLNKKCLADLFQKETMIGYKFMNNIARVIGRRFHKLQEEVVKRKGYETMFDW